MLFFNHQNKNAFVILFNTLLLLLNHDEVVIVVEATPLVDLINDATCFDAPRCGLFNLGITINNDKIGNDCEETCTYLSLLSNGECGECCDPPVTVSTRSFDQDITPDVTFGTGNGNGFFTTVTTDTLELGLRAKTRNPTPIGPGTDITNGNGSQGDGTYKFPEGEFGPENRQSWAFDWHVNTDLMSSGTSFPSDFTFEFGVDSDPSISTNFDQYDSITIIIPIVSIPDNSFDTNAGSGNSGITCTTDPFGFTYQNCLTTKNVVQNSVQYAFLQDLGFVLNFDPNDEGNYVIYLRALQTDPICKEVYIVAEVYIEILVGDTAMKLTSPPTLP